MHSVRRVFSWLSAKERGKKQTRIKESEDEQTDDDKYFIKQNYEEKRNEKK